MTPGDLGDRVIERMKLVSVPETLVEQGLSMLE
jgi:hypothetical protein